MKKIKSIVNSYFKKYKWLLARKIFKTLIVDCSFFKLKISLKDTVIAENFYFYGQYGFQELDATVNYLKENKLLNENGFLDIGANIGFMSLYAISKLQFKSAICVEPDELNYSILKDNLALNNLADKTRSFKVGLSSTTTEGKLIRSNDNYGDHRVFTDNELTGDDKYNGMSQRRIVNIDLITLDELSVTDKAFENISLICIDVQGFELEILKGGRAFLSRGIPMLLEIDPYLLEKKNADKISLSRELQKHYRLFVDVGSKNKEYPIEDFALFYENLKKSSLQHKDILFVA